MMMLHKIFFTSPTQKQFKTIPFKTIPSRFSLLAQGVVGNVFDRSKKIFLLKAKVRFGSIWGFREV
jgi:hypothetical protein